MVLESLISPQKAEKSPFEIFFLGIFYVSIAVLISISVFGSDGSMVMVFLTVLASSVLMYLTLKYEESKDEVINSEYSLLKEHAKALTFFVFLFFGFVVAFTLWFVFLPEQTTSILFSSQLSTIRSINGAATFGQYFLQIFWNNLRVLLFALIFSFFYGFGAIFVLTWNATVIAAAAGTVIKNGLSKIFMETGSITLINYFSTISLGLTKYFIHGIPEMTAYFIGGLAGGILSVSLINFNKKYFLRVLKDVSVLTALSVILLLIAAYIEVGITPIFF